MDGLHTTERYAIRIDVIRDAPAQPPGVRVGDERMVIPPERTGCDLVVGVDVSDDVAFHQGHAAVHGVVHPAIVRRDHHAEWASPTISSVESVEPPSTSTWSIRMGSLR